jgi:ArsR family transcriptional regulator
MTLLDRASALANASRLSILEWLGDPENAFPPQVHGDKDEDGVCGAFIAEKLGVTPATASAHLKILTDAGLVRAKRVGKWTYFKRVDGALEAFGRDVAKL